MQPIKDLINKIKWDKRESPKDYSLIYIDLGKKKELAYTEIKRLEGNFMIIERNNEEVEIPLHRIKEVKKKNKIIWKRP
ncbi:DUF504 domain-containing protein [Candidatus Woesearchaeota archaeon]|nr:DUF504 domain-containing protein [Candidatus Woesearchaeota archaeon]